MQTKINLFLDDERPCPAGFQLVRTGEDCVLFLQKHQGQIQIFSTDHDLGDTSCMNGYDVAKILIEKRLYPEVINLHTANPVGRQNMQELYERYKPEHVKITSVFFDPRRHKSKGGVRYA